MVDSLRPFFFINKNIKSYYIHTEELKMSKYYFMSELCEPTAIRGTRYHVDGYDAETRTCYEYNGCFWHGYVFNFAKEWHEYCRSDVKG